MSPRLTIAAKEIRDHLRDRRSLVSAAMFSLMGPAVILLVSQSPAAGKGGPAVLLGMMSVFTLVSSFTGGMYLAMDSTAGERERGSLVPLLLNPVSRLDLVIGKWLAASAFALAGLALNLAGFTLAFEWAGVVPPNGFTAGGGGNAGAVPATTLPSSTLAARLVPASETIRRRSTAGLKSTLKRACAGSGAGRTSLTFGVAAPVRALIVTTCPFASRPYNRPSAGRTSMPSNALPIPVT